MLLWKSSKRLDEFGRLVEGADFGVQIGSIKAFVGDAHENVNTCLDPLGEFYQTGKLVQVGHRHIKKLLFLTEISSLIIREIESMSTTTIIPQPNLPRHRPIITFGLKSSSKSIPKLGLYLVIVFFGEIVKYKFKNMRKLLLKKTYI